MHSGDGVDRVLGHGQSLLLLSKLLLYLLLLLLHLQSLLLEL
jgi:hypothetical protein